jgi:hypothetical protein
MNKAAQLTENRLRTRRIMIFNARALLKLPLAQRHLFIVTNLAIQIAEESKTTLERGGFVKLFFSKHGRKTANSLLLMAYTQPRMLRDLGEAICNARARLADGVDLVDLETMHPIAEEVVKAYEQCAALVPTLPEVREMFIARKKAGIHKFSWPADFSARRALLSRCLELRPAKRGAPKKNQK